jgi:hypothetical protein
VVRNASDLGRGAALEAGRYAVAAPRDFPAAPAGTGSESRRSGRCCLDTRRETHGRGKQSADRHGRAPEASEDGAVEMAGGRQTQQSARRPPDSRVTATRKWSGNFSYDTPRYRVVNRLTICIARVHACQHGASCTPDHPSRSLWPPPRLLRTLAADRSATLRASECAAPKPTPRSWKMKHDRIA